MKNDVIRTSTFLVALTTAVLCGCGGGGSSSSGDDSNNSLDAALTYIVEEPGSADRRFVTNIGGSARLELEDPDHSPAPEYSPDNQYLAYVKDDRLYVVRTASGRVTELSRFQHSAGSIFSFAWSPNSQYLAYIGDADIVNDVNVYVVNVDGSSHTQVNPDVTSAFVSSNGSGLSFSPASDWITYRSDESDPGSLIYDGYVVRIDGSEGRRFTGSLPDPTFRVGQFTWSPDGRYIAYTVEDVDTPENGGINTHDTTIGGRNSVRISHDFSIYSTGTGSTIDKFQWSPNSNLLAYSLEIFRASVSGPHSYLRRLFTASPGVSASSAETINGPMNNNVEVGEWAWAPNGNYIAYEVITVTDVASGVIRQDEGINTYDVVQGGNGSSNSVRITETTGGPLGQGFKTVEGMAWTADSEHVLYLALIEKSNTKELYRSEPHVSENSTLLSLETGISGQDDVGSFAIAPDGEQVAFSQRSEGVGSPYHIYLTDVLNSFTDMQLSSEPVSNGQLTPSAIRWSAKSTHIAFISDATTPQKAELQVAPNDGSGSYTVSGSIAADADVTGFGFID